MAIVEHMAITYDTGVEAGATHDMGGRVVIHDACRSRQ